MPTILNKTKGNTVSGQAKIADSFLKRLIGLTFRKDMAEDEALIFYQASSIHTFFMRFPIDLVFLNKEKRIIRIVEAIRPWKAVFCSGAYLTLELPPNKAKKVNLELDDVLDVV